MRVREVNVNNLLPPTFSFDAFLPGDRSDYLFFDIETLGFHRISHPVTMIGIATIADGALHFKQWMCDSPSDESTMIEEFFQLITKTTVLISFNGLRFDWPFLVSRAKKHRILPPRPKNHLDLFQFYQGGFSFLNAQSHTLRALTKGSLPFESMDSKEIPDLMRRHFVGKADSHDLDALFLHNEEDLLALFVLEERMENIHEQWQLRLEEGDLSIESIRTTKDYYLVRYRPSNPDFLPALLYQGKNYAIDWIQSDNLLELKFRYLDVESQNRSLHLLPTAWYPFSWPSEPSLFSVTGIPSHLKILKMDEAVDQLLIQEFCRGALQHQS